MFRIFATFAAATFLAGCATTSLFSPYPDQISKVQQAVDTGAGEVQLDELARKAEGGDALLYRLERARLAQMLGQFESSRSDFDLVIAQLDQGDLKATVQASSLMSGAASLVTNDNAIAYEGESFERVFAHAFQALNYLGLKKVEGAEVELRRAADQQRDLAEKYASEIGKAKESAAEKKVPLDTVGGYFSGLDTIAGEVKSSFQNAYVLYLSGVIWEARGESNRALVDFKQALEMYPENELLQAAVKRVDRGAKRDAGKGTLIVLYEEGFAPRKDEIKVPVPTFTGEIVTIAFPFYHASSVQPYGGLTVTAGADTRQAVMLTNVGALAARSLKEKVPGMLVRQTARAVAKHQLQKQAGQSMGLVGQLGGSIYSMLSESADRRSWLMLPAYTAATRLELPEGQQTLSLQAPGVAYDQAVPVRARKTTILRLINTRSRLVPQVFEL